MLDFNILGIETFPKWTRVFCKTIVSYSENIDQSSKVFCVSDSLWRIKQSVEKLCSSHNNLCQRREDGSCKSKSPSRLSLAGSSPIWRALAEIRHYCFTVLFHQGHGWSCGWLEGDGANSSEDSVLPSLGQSKRGTLCDLISLRVKVGQIPACYVLPYANARRMGNRRLVTSTELSLKMNMQPMTLRN